MSVPPFSRLARPKSTGPSRELIGSAAPAGSRTLRSAENLERAEGRGVGIHWGPRNVFIPNRTKILIGNAQRKIVSAENRIPPLDLSGKVS